MFCPNSSSNTSYTRRESLHTIRPNAAVVVSFGAHIAVSLIYMRPKAITEQATNGSVKYRNAMAKADRDQRRMYSVRCASMHYTIADSTGE